MPRSVWAEGSAMFTIVESSTTISWAMAMKASAFQRWGSGRTWAVSDMGELTNGMEETNSARNRREKVRGGAVSGSTGTQPVAVIVISDAVGSPRMSRRFPAGGSVPEHAGRQGKVADDGPRTG